MIPIVFINSASVPFVDLIMSGEKTYETRSRNVLRFLFDTGSPFLIAETGKGKPVVKCSAQIRSIKTILTEEAWNACKSSHRVPKGSAFDWNPATKKKVLYELYNIRPVSVPFTPSECKRHGRTWMEYYGTF